MEYINVDITTAVLDQVLSLVKVIINMAQTAKSNQERCKEIARRTNSIERLALIVKERGPDEASVSVQEALTELCNVLDEVKEWMLKFSQTSRFKSFMQSGSHEGKFCKLDKKLSDCFTILSVALQVEQGDTLHKVYRTVSERRRLHGRQSPSFDPPSRSPSPKKPEPPKIPMPQPDPYYLPVQANPNIYSGYPVNTSYPQASMNVIGFTNTVISGSALSPRPVEVTTNVMGPVNPVFLPPNATFVSYTFNKTFNI